MLSDHLAEWLLESVTTCERAASAVGDLREIAATRGEVWFWASVLRTSASMLWRGMAAHPWLATLEAFIGLVLDFMVQIGASLVYLLIMLLFAKMSGRPMSAADSQLSLSFQAPWLNFWIAVGLSIAGRIFEGRCLARLVPGRELSACLALMMLENICGLGFAVFAKLHNVPLGSVLLFNALALLRFPGALSVRRRAINRGVHA